ncbi:hypothetical protein NECAME_18272 [Necator americanus]|uniref:Uncharacterized protein n=1 Tax=Necator americanus TaxID=51031 RepID=W2SY46_NECAM|nr:hypothetical protein NECAME_18272 [Necator americanus]ETN73532.1 hypothetical protein NECAME_18272 [Necator americanus]
MSGEEKEKKKKKKKEILGRKEKTVRSGSINMTRKRGSADYDWGGIKVREDDMPKDKRAAILSP